MENCNPDGEVTKECHDANAMKEKHLSTKRKSAPGRRKLTSWDYYNILLMQLANKLISLGASKKIKVVAFKLWVSYLRQSHIAFVSKNEKKLPALSLGARDKDVQQLFGVKNLRKKLLIKSIQNGKQSDTDLDTTSSECSESEVTFPKLKKRKTVSGRDCELENEHSSIRPSVEEASTSENVEHLPMKHKRRIVVRSSAREGLKGMSDKIIRPSVVDKKVARNTRSKFLKLVYNRKYKISGIKSPNSPVTTVTLITILRVALQMVGDEIFLGDILRWISEGLLPFNQPTELISTLDIDIQNDLMNMKRQGFQLDILNFTHNLKISDLPTPNLFKLAERYCEDLCLPVEFSRFVMKLIAESNVSMDYSKYQFRIFPDYECRVMAFILFAFKYIFSLDDFTEYQLSDFVDAVEEAESSDDSADVPQLFFWRGWVQYIECRKAVLSKYNVPICQMNYNEGIIEPNVFLDHWEKVKLNPKSSDRKLKKKFVSTLKKECCSLAAENETEAQQVPQIKIPISFTPSKTFIEYLISNHRNLISRRSRKILSKNFSDLSMKYAVNADLSRQIAERYQLNVELHDPIEYFDSETFKGGEFNLLARSKTSFPRTEAPVDVIVDECELPEMIPRETEICILPLENCDPNLECGGSSSSIQIFDSSRYWCFHDCPKLMTVVEFEEVAKNNFPKSFLWLLRECASMLRATIKELYYELILVEHVLLQFYCQSRKKRRYAQAEMDEW